MERRQEGLNIKIDQYINMTALSRHWLWHIDTEYQSKIPKPSWYRECTKSYAVNEKVL